MTYTLTCRKKINMNCAGRLIFAFLFFIIASSVAQTPEYLISTRGDTLHGEVKIFSSGPVDRAQVSVNKKKTTFQAQEIRLLFIENEFYKPMKFENSIRFMKVLKAGYLSLYAFRPANLMTYDGRYIAKMDGAAMEVPNLTFKKTISKFLEDCPTVSTALKEDQYKRSELDKVIDDYNACIDNKTTAKLKATAAESAASEKLDAIKALQNKVEGLDKLDSKKDVTDLLSDLSAKVQQQQTISNYQLEALKSFLKGNKSVKDELEKVVALLTP